MKDPTSDMYEDGNDKNVNFEDVYKRIVVKDKLLDEKKRKSIFKNIVEVSKMKDYNSIMKYEYILKLHFFSSNVNVLNIYKLTKCEYEKEFDEVAKCLKSNILLSIVDTNTINDNSSEHIGEYFLKNYEELRNFDYVIGNTDYPLGFEQNTNGTFKVYLFKIIPSKTLLLNNSNFGYIEKNEIPNSYDSIAVDRSLYCMRMNSKGGAEKKGGNDHRNNSIRNGHYTYNRYYINSYSNSPFSRGYNGKNGLPYSYIYKVKNSEQVLPLLLIEFEFKCLRVDVSVPVCENCCSAQAIYYCYNDKVHLCDICDIKHHEKNKILKNHKRIHISESPYQFGKCAYHPNELIENVCMKCFCSLCPNCILIGNHSRGTYRNHPITNIKDAFILSYQKKSLSDINLENRKIRIIHLLKKKHKQLSEIYSNYTSLQKRIDTLYKYIINELKNVKKKKIEFLMALKRSVLSELLTIEWMDAFFFHTKLSLKFSDFILYQKKHELLIEFLTAKVKETNFFKYIPHWVFQKIYVHSDLYIYEDNFYKINLANHASIDNTIIGKKERNHNKDCLLKISENKLESMYNFNTMFNDKNRHFALYDDDKLKEHHDDRNECYAKLALTHQAGSRDHARGKAGVMNETEVRDEEAAVDVATGTEAEALMNLLYDGNPFSGKNREYHKYDMMNKEDINEVIELRENYCSIYELTSEKQSNNHLLLYTIFKNEKMMEKQAEMSNMKNSYIYKELWKNLLNYKYLNIIHILKVRYSYYNTLELATSFLNISNYYNMLEDLVRHIIKHEIYTLFNKNIDYHTKMKVTQLLDTCTTLLCIRNFKLSFLVDKYVEMCYVEVEKNENQILEEVKNIRGKDMYLYEVYLEQKKGHNCIVQNGGRKGDRADENSERVHTATQHTSVINGTVADEQSADLNINEKRSKGEEKELGIRENEKKGITTKNLGNRLGEEDYTMLEEDNFISEEVINQMNNDVEHNKWINKNEHENRTSDIINDKEKEEFDMLNKIKEYIYIYMEKLINDIINIPHKDLNDSIRFLFYLIHDEIDGTNKSIIMNQKNFSIHTLTLCLDLFLNSILYPYIIYVHEHNISKSIKKNSLLYQKVILLFAQTLREISIYTFQIYNIGIYENNIKIIINDIRNNKIMQGKMTNDNMFFLDSSQKLFRWIIKNLEAPRYYSPIKWNPNESIERSYERVVSEIISIDKSTAENCVNENVDYNILFSTINFKDILALCYSVERDNA
ncbi:zinc finger protein [Plasmodium brasilianum]|uniref:B box-type domain-containing protein n=2 Tax=Plasmodium (Plasmodium) TaxID=418103 RepID=A0A1A8W7J7_PLAMA|nr:conserved Plasmodium protein, unknown function [Plasmodium malariae]KAI4836868.1 zinc finger protein [Plasmodium brasilianum]SBS88978.1 conserved Plasmodium protein, unknown function [Plasmodium malariae]SCO94168.1 conserved Plasmodium protein, unknown function [Plasmodium malariae]